MRTLRSRRALLGALTSAAVAAACAGPPTTAPAAPGTARDASAARLAPPRESRASTAPTLATTDTSYVTLRVNPHRTQSWKLGEGHGVQITAHSVCDPAKSSYGPTEWDKPCTTIKRPITVTAKSWTTADGSPMVEFSPDLRFAPGSENTLLMVDRSAVGDHNYEILWCPARDQPCVDEGLVDPRVVTKRGWRDGFLYRRIKHFSGYTVAVGRSAVY